MFNRRTLRYSIFGAAVLALCLPMLAAAQGSYRYPDYQRDRDRDYRSYDPRYIRDSIHRLDRLAKDFQRDLDRALDRSRQDGSRREDRINAEARDFRQAVSNLKSRFGNGRDLDRSSNEAQRVFQEAQQLERLARPRWFDSRLSAEWSQIRQELNTLANAYRNSNYDGGYDRGRGRNDDYRRGNNEWWRRIPWPN